MIEKYKLFEYDFKAFWLSVLSKLNPFTEYFYECSFFIENIEQTLLFICNIVSEMEKAISLF